MEETLFLEVELSTWQYFGCRLLRFFGLAISKAEHLFFEVGDDSCDTFVVEFHFLVVAAALGRRLCFYEVAHH
jgi:hypothetical protein